MVADVFLFVFLFVAETCHLHTHLVQTFLKVLDIVLQLRLSLFVLGDVHREIEDFDDVAVVVIIRRISSPKPFGFAVLVVRNVSFS